jgi:predicted nucleic acid-binding protein
MPSLRVVSRVSTVVLDASVVVDSLLTERAAIRLAAEVGDATPCAPDLIDAEVMSTLRRLARARAVSERAAHLWVVEQSKSPIVRVPHADLLPAAWLLRHNLTAYDALYVALAQALDTRLIVSDARLVGAPHLGVAVTVLPAD